MSHRKEHHAEHSTVTSAPIENERSVRHFLRVLGVYLSRHWAWPVIIALWWFFRTHRNLSDAADGAFFVVTGIVVILGWTQLTANSYWRGYFGILLAFAGLTVFIVAFPILFVLFLIAVIAVGIDLFIVAPHRGL